MVPKASLNRIRLELAKTTGLPSGSTWHGYEFFVPLTADGQVDEIAWSELKELCLARRYFGDRPEEHGKFIHSGQCWCFEYPAGSTVGKESLFKLDRFRFTPGGFVTVTEPDGRQLPFRIVAMTPTLPAY